MSICRHIFDHGHDFLEIGVLRVSHEVKSETLEGGDLNSHLLKTLDACVSVVVAHGADGVYHQMDVEASLKQVERRLLHTNMRFSSIKHNLVPRDESFDVSFHLGVDH